MLLPPSAAARRGRLPRASPPFHSSNSTTRTSKQASHLQCGIPDVRAEIVGMVEGETQGTVSHEWKGTDYRACALEIVLVSRRRFIDCDA